jgi:hypothetical protein
LKLETVIAKISVIFSNNISKTRSRKNHHTAKKEEISTQRRRTKITLQEKNKNHATGEEQKSRYRRKTKITLQERNKKVTLQAEEPYDKTNIQQKLINNQ